MKEILQTGSSGLTTNTKTDIHPETIHIVASFHYDVAYQDTFEGYLPKSFAALHSALDLLEQIPDYIYHIEQVVLLREYWNRHPEEQERIRRFAKEGRLHFAPGMFTMPDSNIPCGESFIRNALLGRHWLQKNLTVTPECCWMADVFGHNPQSPQLARTCGYSSYMFERGKAGTWDATFRWQGIDGTEIDAHWEVDTYFGLTLGFVQMKHKPDEWSEEEIRKRIEDEVFVYLRKHGPLPGVMLTPLGGDFWEPGKRELEFLEKWSKENKQLHFQFSTPGRYFDILRKHNVNLPTEKVDLNPLCEGAYSSRISLKQSNRRLEELAQTLEMLEWRTEADTASPHAASEALWEVLAWNAFHDIICGTLEREAYREALEMYERAEQKATAEIEKQINEFSSGNEKNNGEPALLVFNSLPYPRREIIPITEENTDAPEGRRWAEVDCQAAGYSVVFPDKVEGKNTSSNRGNVCVEKSGEGFFLENEHLRLSIEKNATLTSFHDKHTGVEHAFSDDGLNNLIQTRDHGDLWILDDKSINASLLRTAPFPDPRPPKGGVQREGRIGRAVRDAEHREWEEGEIGDNDPLCASVLLTCPELQVEISLRKGERFVRFRTRFLPKGMRYRLTALFPTTISSGTIRQSVPFGHLERPEGWYPAQGWTDYRDAKKGLLLLNRGLPANNVTDGVMMLGLFRAVSMEKLEKYPNYEEDVPQIFEYALMPFDPADAAYNPARSSALFHRKLEMQKIKNPPSEFSTAKEPLIQLEGTGAELSCCRREGETTILRIWESQGKESAVRLSFRESIRSCETGRATGENRQPLAHKLHVVSLSLSPFEIKTLFVQFSASAETESKA